MEARHAHIASPAHSSPSPPTPKPISCTLPFDDDYYFFFLSFFVGIQKERRWWAFASISLSHRLVFDWNVRRPLRNHRLRRAITVDTGAPFSSSSNLFMFSDRHGGKAKRERERRKQDRTPFPETKDGTSRRLMKTKMARLAQSSKMVAPRNTASRTDRLVTCFFLRNYLSLEKWKTICRQGNA